MLESKYILCDILFDYTSPDDTLLKPIIESTKNLVTTSIYKNGALVRPVFNVQSGCVNYTVTNTSLFTKMPLMYADTVKSLPVLMYENVTKNAVIKRHGLTYFNNRLGFNTIIPELYYRPADMNTSGAHANTYYLGDLVTTPDFFNNYLKNKYIVIGDFPNDKHHTYMGSVPGALLLIDTFLTLQHKQPVISFVWLIILFVVYFLISYIMFIHPDKKFKELHEKIKFTFLRRIILKYISFIGIMMLIDWISYFFYATFVSVFYIATYLTFLEIIIEKYNPVRKKITEYMKKFKLIKTAALLVPLFLCVHLCGQTYSVSALMGNVYYNSKLVKKGDTLANPENLFADNASAKIRLLNPQTGSVMISFINSKPVVAQNADTHSELYELTVKEYISKYYKKPLTGYLSTRGSDFDWFVFFVDSVKNRMPVFENEKIPLTGSTVVPDTAKFLAVVYNGNDSVFKDIPVINDSLFFPAGIFPMDGSFTWRLAMSYADNNSRHISIITHEPIVSRVISENDLEKLLQDFLKDWKQNYASANKAKLDLYAFLSFNYGYFYYVSLDKMISDVLSTK